MRSLAVAAGFSVAALVGWTAYAVVSARRAPADITVVADIQWRLFIVVGCAATLAAIWLIAAVIWALTKGWRAGRDLGQDPGPRFG